MTRVEPTEADLATIAADREASEAEARLEAKEPVARVEDVSAGGVPARLYVPDGADGVLLYLHGGGFALGDLVTHDGISRRLANRTGWAVLLVDYRRSPEHPWPAADQDAAAAADWLVGQDFARRAVLGDSAGAALALNEAIRRPERYAAQVLVYPFVDPTCASYDRQVEVADLDLARCELFWRLYLQGADASADPALNVLVRRSLVGLPPTLVQLAERDVLTAVGQRLADRLRSDGVPSVVEVHPGVEHGFWRRTDNDRSEPALATVAAFLTDLDRQPA